MLPASMNGTAQSTKLSSPKEQSQVSLFVLDVLGEREKLIDNAGD
jgi:hypothetical protein